MANVPGGNCPRVGIIAGEELQEHIVYVFARALEDPVQGRLADRPTLSRPVKLPVNNQSLFDPAGFRQSVCIEEKGVADVATSFAFGAAQRGRQSFAGLPCADLSQRRCRRGGDLFVAILQQRNEQGDRFPVAAVAERVDDARLGSTAGFRQRLAQSRARFGIGHRFQRVAGRMGKQLVGQ